MISRKRWRAFEAQGWVQTVEFGLGILLLIIAALVGPIPGPGGIFFAAPGLALILRTSLWAKKRYVRFKRWHPNIYYIRFQRWRPKVAKRRVSPGQWTDWALRRQSPRRREALRKQRESQSAEQLGAVIDLDGPLE
jgi:hypothetical protein